MLQVSEILVSRLGFLRYEHFIPVTTDESGTNSGGLDGTVLHCIACCIFHIISIPFNCSDTALAVAETMIRGES